MTQQAAILIADSSEEFRLALAKQMEDRFRVLSCREGREALEILAREPVEVLVTGLCLEGLDGLSLLRAVTASGRTPGLLVTAEYVSPYILDRLGSLGVSRVLRKPCAPARIEQAILALLQSREAGSLCGKLSAILLQLGFCPKHRGYAYLREAVLRTVEEPDRAMVKELYREVGAHFGTTGKLTEHAIRCALREACGRGDPALWQLCLGPGRKPTSAVLIRRLAAILREDRPLPRAAGD